MVANAALDRIAVETPCRVPWATMAGDDRVRFCCQCNKHVYNIEDLSRAEAETLIASRTGELCVRFYRRPDGTVVTRDCSPRFRLLRLAAWLFICSFVAVSFVFGLIQSNATARESQSRYNNWARKTEPFKTALEWIDPSPKPAPTFHVMGKRIPQRTAVK